MTGVCPHLWGSSVRRNSRFPCHSQGPETTNSEPQLTRVIRLRRDPALNPQDGDTPRNTSFTEAEVRPCRRERTDERPSDITTEDVKTSITTETPKPRRPTSPRPSHRRTDSGPHTTPCSRPGTLSSRVGVRSIPPPRGRKCHSPEPSLGTGRDGVDGDDEKSTPAPSEWKRDETEEIGGSHPGGSGRGGGPVPLCPGSSSRRLVVIPPFRLSAPTGNGISIVRSGTAT